MRTINPSLALASLVGFLAAASCTLITDVDRTKIPTDAGAEGGSPGTGGTGGMSGKGGTGGMSGKGGTGGTSGSAGEGGQNNTGGTSTGGGAGMAPVTPECAQATGKINIGPKTYFSDGDTFTLNDGVRAATVFEFDHATQEGVASGHRAIAFNGSEDQFEMALLVTQAVNDEHTRGALHIVAEMVALDVTGAGGAAGTSGAGGAPSAAGNGGQGGAAPDLSQTAEIQLTNDLAGERGNVRIKDTVGNPNFTTSGMSGGKAVSCASPASCNTDDECASQTCGSDHVCQ